MNTVLIKGVSSFQGVILYTSLGSHNHSNTQYLDRKASYYTQFSKKGGNTPTKSKLKSLLVRYSLQHRLEGRSFCTGLQPRH